MISPSSRVRCEDQRFDADESDSTLSNYLFIRVSAKDKTFRNVDFKYCIFDGCYLRGCKFINCDFTGCKFVSTNFHASKFSNCEFAYVSFEKTLISDDILETQSPHFENQQARFARTLRVNFQQLGEAESVNKAIKIELAATRAHLYKAWHSKDDYYRHKYVGLRRVSYFLKWLWFSTLHWLWGNGESAIRLVWSMIGLFVLMAIYDAIRVGDPGQVQSYWQGFKIAPQVFLGTRSFPQYGNWYITTVAALKLLLFAALTSILLKRFNRR
jgi:hypothetical protein